MKKAVSLVVVAISLMSLMTPLAEAQSRAATGLIAPVTTADGLTGTFRIRQFVQFTNPDPNAVNTGIGAVGTLVLQTADGVQRIANVTVPVTGIGTSGAQSLAIQQVGACDILHLTLGPIHLDLLGLVVDLNQVQLDIVAVPGSGNLLGNLLCAIAGLLDQGGPLSNLLQQIINLLNQILGILG